MQSRRYADAVKLIEAAIQEENKQPVDYLLYLKAIALLNDNEGDAAVSTFNQLESDHPDSRWISRSRFGRAAVAVSDRDYDTAGIIYRAEAERLLSNDRRDELAKIYLEFADRYFEGIPAKTPSGKRVPDYKQALQYYREAKGLRPSLKQLQFTEFRIARCQEELGELDAASNSYTSFLDDYGTDNPESGSSADLDLQGKATWRLGRSQLKNGKPAAARRTWQTLFDQFAERGADNKVITELLAQARYQMPQTYGIPSPATVGDMELGITLAEQFLEEYPDHQLAPKTELEIAQSYQRHGRNLQAVTRLTSMIANDTYKKSDQLAQARQLLGQAELAQQNFEQAIVAWKSFLENHPTDPQWPVVQQQIVTAEYASAQHAYVQKDYDGARSKWQTFLNKYPLDPRSPEIFYLFGDMNFAQAQQRFQDAIEAAVQSGASASSVVPDDQSKELFQQAIADWKKLVQKYPSSGQASNAALRIGVTLEDKLDLRTEALEAYRIVNGPRKPAAAARISRLTRPELQVMTQRKFRSNEPASIQLTTRNLKDVSVAVYSIDMTDYFRKMHLASGVEKLDIALIDPETQFQHNVQDYEEFKRLEQEIRIPTDGAGVLAVTVSSDKLEATTMLVVSDLDVIVKSSRNELFTFAQNMLTGRPAQDVQILVSDGNEVFGEGSTDQDGVFRSKDEQLRSATDLRVFAHQDGHTASTVNSLNGLDFAVGLTPKGVLFTDRPVYRPGELVNIKGVVRWVDEDRFTFQKGETFQLDIYDARGRKLKSQKVALNGFGTIHTNLLVPKATPSGRCRIHLHRAANTSVGSLSFESSFEVKPFRLEPVRLEVDTDRDVFFRGDKIVASIELNYYYGAPVADEEVIYSIGGDEETQKGRTNEKGQLDVTFKTNRFSESQPLAIQVQCPQRNVSRSHVVYLATRGFNVQVNTVRNVLIAGETFESQIKLTSPSGEPVSEKLKIEVFAVTQSAATMQQTRQTRNSASPTAAGERLIETFEVESDPKTGEARKSLQIDEGGQFIVRATGKDQFGNEVSGQVRVQVSDDNDKTRLRVLADRHHYRAGEVAEVRLHWREAPSLALITYDGASVLGYQIVRLKKGDNQLRIPMESGLAPNFHLSVTVMHDHRFHQAGTDLSVANQLTVKLTPSALEVEPENPLKVDVQVTDASGQGVQAELAVGMVQSSVWERFGVDGQQLVRGFQSQNRQRRIRQASSCTFKYAPKTESINDALIAESERRLIESAEADARLDLADGRMMFGGAVNSDAGVAANFGDESGNGAMPPSSGSWAYPGTPGNAIGGYAGQSQVIVGDFAVPQSTLPINRLYVLGNQLPSPYYRSDDQSGAAQGEQVTGGVQSRFSSRQDGAQVYYDYSLNRNAAPMLSKRLGYVNGGVLDRFSGSAPGSDGWADGSLQSQSQTVWFSNDFGIEQTRWDRATINALTSDGKLSAVNAATDKYFLAFARDNGARMMGVAVTGETGFWDPVIITDADGVASVEIALPSESTAWKVHANAISVNSEAGADSVEVLTRKSLFSKVRLPQAFTVGDQPLIPVEVHSTTEKSRQLGITLKVQMGNESYERSETLEVKQSGIKTLKFPAEIRDTDLVKLEVLITESGKVIDSQVTEVPVLPYGVTLYRSASGTAAQNTLAMLGFEEGKGVQPQSLKVLIGGNISQSLLDSMTIGQSLLPARCVASSRLERSAADCLAGVALLDGLRTSNQAGSPKASQIEESLVAAISNLVTAQRDDGGWSRTGTSGGDSDAMLSSRILWALGAARDAGFAVPNEQLQLAITRLKSDFAKQNRLDQQAIILSALSEVGAGDFALANRLYRERNRLSPLGVAHLMLALTSLRHPEMAQELERQFAARRNETASYTGATEIEIAAIRLIAMQRFRGEAQVQKTLAEIILAGRSGTRWQIESENGPAISSLASHFSSAQASSQSVKLTVFVNGEEIDQLEIKPGSPSKTLNIDRSLLIEGRQKIEFELEGRGEFTYSAVMQGFVDADSAKTSAKDWSLKRRYEPDEIRIDGRRVRRGHGIIQGSYSWKPNTLTELPLGQRGVVTLSPRVRYQNSRPLRRYLMLIEPIPAGCSVLEETITGVFDRYEVSPGAITFYIGDQKTPGDIRYTVAGYLEGTCHAAPAVLRSYFSPDEIAVSQPGELKILAADEKSTDEYRMTPDELFALGNHFYSNDKFAKAADFYKELTENWRLDPEPYKACVTSLFRTSLQLEDAPETVKYFETIKERFPDVELSFDEILKVAASYRDIAEYERSYLVYRATIQGNFEKENQVAGFLNARGELLRSIETMESLLRDYPPESYVATASYALAQEVYRRAPSANKITCLRDAGLTRIDLVDASIRMLDDFLTNWPEDPSGDQASFALATALIDLQEYEKAIERGREYAKRFPKSRLLDSYWYMIGFCYFELQDHQKALEMCRKVAEAKFNDGSTSVSRDADNKWEAIYIMGQIYHSLGQAAKAIDEYGRVSDRFKDAAEAINFFSRQSIELPDVTTMPPGEETTIVIKHRNLKNAFVKVYRIDLMKFGLTRRNLDRITAINLAGIKPYHETQINFGDGKDYDDLETEIKLPLNELGAYLVVARGSNLYSSGLVVISPLVLEADEDPVSGRVRVTVQDSDSDKYVGDVDVKVIGSSNEDFVSGKTDLRGLFVADDIRGTSTVIAVGEGSQYAFHRGSNLLQPQQTQNQDLAEQQKAASQTEETDESAPSSKAGKPLLNNLFNLNGMFQMEQKLNIDNLMNNSREGIQSKEAY